MSFLTTFFSGSTGPQTTNTPSSILGEDETRVRESADWDSSDMARLWSEYATMYYDVDFMRNTVKGISHPPEEPEEDYNEKCQRLLQQIWRYGYREKQKKTER